MSKRQTLILVVLTAMWICTSDFAHAQLSGHNSRGDYGLQSGSQAPPGWYLVAPMYYRYSADEFRDRHGDNLPALAGGGSIEANAWLAGAIWVSDHKLLGGNYSFVIFPGVTNNALGFPALGVDERASTGLADLYVQPVNLGWSTPRADFVAGIGIFAPTGEYEPGGSSNRGLGMWSYELFG
ncbi:MAG: transporter, partial [Gammaproteobacteria bacterium]|nr:transporter [Gammaproteobacteria bacterium]